ncbi:MAG TPA: hypothetical protein VK115_06755 [Staphylococcus sp.]|nr:hypothetical protein [Staphylococcus sp.]
MTKEIQIRSWVNQTTGEVEFVQTHVDGVIGLEEKIEELTSNQSENIILRSPEGRKFRLTVDNSGKLGTVPVEEG